jgi:hypothetical protein
LSFFIGRCILTAFILRGLIGRAFYGLLHGSAEAKKQKTPVLMKGQALTCGTTLIDAICNASALQSADTLLA